MKARDNTLSPRVEIPVYNVISMNGVACQKPVRVIGPTNYYKLITEADFGRSPLDNSTLNQASFEQVLAVAGYALQRPEDKDVAQVINAINGKDLTGRGIFLLSPLEAMFFSNPGKDLIYELGRNDQNVLSRAYWDARKKLKGAKETDGVLYCDGIRMARRENIIFGIQERDIFAKNPGLLLATGDREIAQDLTLGSNEYTFNPSFNLPFDNDGLVVAIPVLCGDGFSGRLLVGGFNACKYVYSFGVFDSAQGVAPKTEGEK
jgi:hypothetical protein